ncbi:MAG TPA: DUF3160 domain-containing protein, partial [Aggregatilineales bacterium]|nr:DUF3160 domain-containing protein [Aggregatilineales bacterium]
VCPGTAPSFISVGKPARVTITTPGQISVPLKVHAQPSLSGTVIGQLADATPLTVLSGPNCVDHYTWWQVQSPALTGWVAEGVVGSYFIEPMPGSASTPTPALTPTLNIPTITGLNGNVFASFEPGNVDTSASVAPYQVSPDFSNVIVSAPLPPDNAAALKQNMFFVSPNQYGEFFMTYRNAVDSYQPILVTTDSMLHSFHLMFDKVLRTSEANYFVPLLQQTNAAFLAKADKSYQQFKGTDWESAALHAVAYFGVATKLVNPSSAIPAYASAIVNQEIASINQASGIAPSAVFPALTNGEDWSQYTPRGHYTKSDALSAYFRAMIYYGRMTFRLKQDDETKSALMVAETVRDTTVAGAPGINAWASLYQPTVFFVGHSDDLSIPDYLSVMDKVYGANAPLPKIQAAGIAPFQAAAQALPSPKIMGAVVQQGQNVEDETKGMRFMGQRFVWDAYAMGQLIYFNVGTKQNPRTIPMALDVFAALGSDRALSLLDKAGATAYQNYSSQMTKVRSEISALTEPDWSDTLYDGWLYSLKTLTQPVASGYPSVMTSDAYTDRNLYAALGSYTELKHDTILYAKQAAGGLGGGGEMCKPGAPEPVVPPNYVEPVPLFWARLAALAEMTIQGLGGRHLLSPQDADTLNFIATRARSFEQDAIAELHNQPLSDKEQASLTNYSQDLGTILGAANADNSAYNA